jgi:hypothetical protein
MNWTFEFCKTARTAGKASPRAILKYIDINKVSAQCAALPRQALEALREIAAPPSRPDDVLVFIDAM